ncbi:MAG: hypothetical protein WCG81_16975, partial [Candidatus Angelobacter sp.]
LNRLEDFLSIELVQAGDNLLFQATLFLPVHCRDGILEGGCDVSLVGQNMRWSSHVRLLP